MFRFHRSSLETTNNTSKTNIQQQLKQCHPDLIPNNQVPSLSGQSTKKVDYPSCKTFPRQNSLLSIAKNIKADTNQDKCGSPLFRCNSLCLYLYKGHL